MMTPMLNEEIQDMDEAKMRFAEALNKHLTRVREELRMTELLLHSVIRSISNQTEETAQLDLDLQQQRQDSAHHRPMVMSTHEQEVMRRLEDTLRNDARNVNTTN